jgi:hypothetical protein
MALGDIQLDWLNPEKSSLLATLPKQWTGQEFVELRRQVNAMRDAVDHVVHTVVDVRQSGRIPNGFVTSFPQISRLGISPRRGFSVGGQSVQPGGGAATGYLPADLSGQTAGCGYPEEALAYIEQNA